METAEQLLKTILKRLDVLIALNLMSMDDKSTATDHIKLLDRFGLTPTDIGGILNKSPDYVSVVKSNAKKSNKSKK